MAYDQGRRDHSPITLVPVRFYFFIIMFLFISLSFFFFFFFINFTLIFLVFFLNFPSLFLNFPSLFRLSLNMPEPKDSPWRRSLLVSPFMVETRRQVFFFSTIFLPFFSIPQDFHYNKITTIQQTNKTNHTITNKNKNSSHKNK